MTRFTDITKTKQAFKNDGLIMFSENLKNYTMWNISSLQWVPRDRV